MTSTPHPDRAPSTRRRSKDDTGRTGEDLAAAHLVRHGHEILDRNWRAPHGRGELDLVTRHRDDIVIVEVKTRSSLRYGHPFEAIGRSKLERLHRLGWAWCAANGRRREGLRVDAVAVLLPDDGPALIEHLEGVR